MRLSNTESTTLAVTTVTDISQPAQNHSASELSEDDAWSSISWRDRLPTDTNESTPIIGHDPAMFRFVDYAASYSNDMDSSSPDVVIKQNQMLPIYCSIMGMIILSLLLYVVYKLWKQREAMATAKLSEVFSNGTNGLDKVLIRTPTGSTTEGGRATTPTIPITETNSGVLSSARSNPVDGVYDELHHARSASETRSHGKRSGHKAREPNGAAAPEKHPLIAEAQSSATDWDYLEQPVKVIPRNTLGFLCYSLAQNGWRELATSSGIELTEHFQRDQFTPEQRSRWPLLDELLQATKSAQPVDGAPQHAPTESEMTGAAWTLSQLVERSDMTLNKFFAVLGQSGRSDLTSVLTANGFLTAKGS